MTQVATERDEAQGGAPPPVPSGGPSRWRTRLVRRGVPALIVLALLGAVIAVALMRTGQRPSPSAELPPVNIEVQTIRAIPSLAETFTLPAVVEPDRVVRVSAEVAGRIDRILAREGVRATAGQTLIELNKDLIQGEYDRAKAELAYNRNEYDRMMELNARGVATPKELDQLRTAMEVGQAVFNLAAARLERCRIAAPIDGVLSRLDPPPELGQYVQPGTLVAEIVDEDPAKVVVNMPERDVRFLSLGAKEEVTVGPADDLRVEGEVTYIGKLADPQTRTTRVEVSVANADGRLRIGQIVTATLTRRVLTDVVLIPLLAVIPEENGYCVYVANDDTAHRRPVKIGMIRGTDVQVTEGLKAGDRLIVSGHRLVGPGQKVRVVQPESPPAPAASAPALVESAPAMAPAERGGR